MILSGLAGLVLTGCSGSPGTRFDARVPGAREISWPAPPSEPRIRYVGSIAGPSDIGAGRSFFSRIVSFVTGSSAERRIVRPYGIAVGPSGRIVVADPEAGGVHVFDPREREYRMIREGDGFRFQAPTGVAVDTLGRIFVTDAATGSVIRTRPDGDEAVLIARGLSRPAGVAFAPARGSLFVVDVGAHEVVEMGPDGEARSSFGGRGSDAGRFNFPTNVVAAPDGTLYVSDSMNFRIQRLEPDGSPIESFGKIGDARGELARPKGVGVDSEGHVYVVEGLFDVVNIYGPSGRFLLSFGGPGAREGQFWLSTGLAVDARDRIYVADSYNSRIQVFQYLGSPESGRSSP